MANIERVQVANNYGLLKGSSFWYKAVAITRIDGNTSFYLLLVEEDPEKGIAGWLGDMERAPGIPRAWRGKKVYWVPKDNLKVFAGVLKNLYD